MLGRYLLREELKLGAVDEIGNGAGFSSSEDCASKNCVRISDLQIKEEE